MSRWACLSDLLRAVDWSQVAAGPPARPAPPPFRTVAVKGGKNVAVIPLSGTLMKGMPFFSGTSTVAARQAIRDASADPTVSAILLAIDSPGGTVAGTADLAADVRAAQRGKNAKPVWAHVDDLAASAAYWGASAAGAVYANSDTALVGSIGTVLTMYDLSKKAEAEGVVPRVFATGDLKGAGTPGTPITDAQAGHFQSIVNGLQASFDADVMRGRGLSKSALAEAKTGGVFRAEDAVRMKLIDGIQPMGRTIEALAAAAG
jgi:signal peptide peptidase SppA